MTFRGFAPAFAASLMAIGLMLASAAPTSADPFSAAADFLSGGAPMGKRYQFGVGGSGPIARSTVSFDTKYKPGTIVVNTKERRLYYVLS